MPLGAARLSLLAYQAAVAASGRTAVPLTANGNVQISTSQSQFGGGSIAFDGYNDYLSFPSGTVDDSATDFTYEGWFRFTILPQNQTANGSSYMMIYSNNGTGGSGGYLLLDHNGSERFIQVADSSTYMSFTDPGNNWATNTWYHIAVVRESDQYDVYIDGSALTRPATSTKSGGFISGANGFIGQFIDPRGSINGYADEIRISSSARYTSNFTPPNAPFVNDANTLLLIHADGANGSTVFTDDTGTPAAEPARTAVTVTATGNAQIDTSQSKFGGASAYFDGSGDYLEINSIDTPAFGTGDFTLEYWVNLNVLPYTNGYMYWDQRPGSNGNYPLLFTDNNNSTNLRYFINGADRIVGPNGTLAVGAWRHIAVVRNSGTTKMYVDGTQVGADYADGADYQAGRLRLGANMNGINSLNGWMDEIRMSNIARYTTNFAPINSPFVNDANTLLLIHADGANGSTVFTDDNT